MVLLCVVPSPLHCLFELHTEQELFHSLPFNAIIGVRCGWQAACELRPHARLGVTMAHETLTLSCGRNRLWIASAPRKSIRKACQTAYKGEEPLYAQFMLWTHSVRSALKLMNGFNVVSANSTKACRRQVWRGPAGLTSAKADQKRSQNRTLTHASQASHPLAAASLPLPPVCLQQGRMAPASASSAAAIRSTPQLAHCRGTRIAPLRRSPVQEAARHRLVAAGQHRPHHGEAADASERPHRAHQRASSQRP
jgi:hypothetical protein